MCTSTDLVLLGWFFVADGGDYNWEGAAAFCSPIVLNLKENLSLTEKEQEEFVIVGEGNFRFWWCRKVSTGGTL